MKKVKKHPVDNFLAFTDSFSEVVERASPRQARDILVGMINDFSCGTNALPAEKPMLLLLIPLLDKAYPLLTIEEENHIGLFMRDCMLTEDPTLRH